MSRGPAHLVCRIRFAWWLRWYTASLVLAVRLTGRTPDMDKVAAVFRRAVRVDVVRSVSVAM